MSFLSCSIVPFELRLVVPCTAFRVVFVCSVLSCLNIFCPKLYGLWMMLFVLNVLSCKPKYHFILSDLVMIGRNNPFNIRFYSVNNWLGQTVPNKGFCQFVSFDLGLRAGFCLLKTYIHHGYDNVVSIVSHFAPPNDNDTRKYISYVQSQFDAYGLSERNIKFDSNQFFVLAKAILWYESNFTLTVDRYNRIMNNFLR